MNKKVLLRERKRHTARRVVSTPSVVLPGSPPPGGYLTQVPPPRGGPDPGNPPPGGVPGSGTPRGGPGTPPPPRCLMAFWEMLQSIMGYGYPPPVDRQIDGWTDACQNITFPRTTYAGGNNINQTADDSGKIKDKYKFSSHWVESQHSGYPKISKNPIENRLENFIADNAHQVESPLFNSRNLPQKEGAKAPKSCSISLCQSPPQSKLVYFQTAPQWTTTKKSDYGMSKSKTPTMTLAQPSPKARVTGQEPGDDGEYIITHSLLQYRTSHGIKISCTCGNDDCRTIP